MQGGSEGVAVRSLDLRRHAERGFLDEQGVAGDRCKAALESLVRYLAVELAPHGITVNAVSGGLVDTDALRAFPDWQALVAQTVAATPERRLGLPDDIASVVSGLVGDQLDWMRGQVLHADGGASLR